MDDRVSFGIYRFDGETARLWSGAREGYTRRLFLLEKSKLMRRDSPKFTSMRCMTLQ